MPAHDAPELLGPVDTAFLHVESDTSPMNIGAVSVFAGRIDFQALVAHVDARIHMAPLYQKRLYEAPLNLGGPSWRFDPDFHVGNHVFALHLDRPGTDGQLRELAGRLISRTLPRSKPLWEMYLIDGLTHMGDRDGDFTAIVFKVHHAMVDGLSAIELITLLFDLTPNAKAPPKKPIYDPPDLPTTLDSVVESVRNDLAHKWGVLNKLGSDLSFLAETLGQREKRRRMFRGLANLLNDNLRPIKPLSINGKNTGKITVAWADFSLAEVRAIRQQRRATINDVMVTVLASAVERYERDMRGADAGKAPFIRVLVPVNMRVENDKNAFGNRISVLPLDCPFGLSDPLDRLEAVTDYSAVMKNSYLANTLDMVLTMPALALAPVQPLIWTVAPVAFAFLAHTWCTNVAGPQIPIYLLGHEMLHSFGFFPLNPSMGLACVVMSYNQRITMNLIADEGIVADVVKLKSYLESSFAELRRAAKVEPVQPLVLERVKAEAAPPPAEPAPVADPAPADPAPADPAPAETAPVTGAVDAAAEAEKPVTEAVANAKPDKAEPAAEVVADAVADAVVDAKPDKAEPAAEVVTEPVTELVVETVAGAAALPAALPVAVPVSAARATADNLLPSASPAPVLTAPAPITASVNGHAGSAKGEKLRLFSEPWAAAFKAAINASAEYRAASLKWTAGSLAFVMKAAPEHGYLNDTAVIMDLSRGTCRDARALSAREALAQAAFVIEGDHRTWKRVLAGAAPPLTMLIRGELHLKQGSMMRLIPFTQSAQELLKCAQRVPFNAD